MMLLHRIHLNPRNKEARRDLADPYQMHATLCRAYYSPDTRCPPGALLWRLEPETDRYGRPRVLIQSRMLPDWSRLPTDWLAPALTDTDLPISPGIDLAEKLLLDKLAIGQLYRFRLRANPCKTVQGKRTGLIKPEAQRIWLARKGEQHGFELLEPDTVDYFDFQADSRGHRYPDVRLSHDQMLIGRRHEGNEIRVYSVMFDGRLVVKDPGLFRSALENGIGHAKMMGLGLLSVIPASR
jgi:CRISPR system Cascade subunit CasE